MLHSILNHWSDEEFINSPANWTVWHSHVIVHITRTYSRTFRSTCRFIKIFSDKNSRLHVWMAWRIWKRSDLDMRIWNCNQCSIRVRVGNAGILRANSTSRDYRNEKRGPHARVSLLCEKDMSATRYQSTQHLSSSTITETRNRNKLIARNSFCFTSFCVCVCVYKNCSQVASKFFVATHFVCAECESI